MYGRLSVVKQSGSLWHWIEIAAMYAGSIRSICYGPTMNIREWAPHHYLGLGCPWCKTPYSEVSNSRVFKVMLPPVRARARRSVSRVRYLPKI
jgi:hypothetical protein